MSAGGEALRHLRRLAEIGAALGAEAVLCTEALLAAGCDVRLNEFGRIEEVVVPGPYQPTVRSPLSPWLRPETPAPAEPQIGTAAPAEPQIGTAAP